MKKRRIKLLSIILIVIIFIAMTAAIIYSRYENRTHFNTSNISGNTAGNYYNTGLFCEYNGIVYFSNPYDDYTLYQMTPQGTQARQIGTDKVSFINVDDNYIYYVRDNQNKSPKEESFAFATSDSNSLCRIKHNGKQPITLDEKLSLYAALSGNYIYYIQYDKKNASTLYKVKLDGTEQEKLSSSPLLLSPSDDGTLCYNGVKTEHNIWLWDSSTDTSSLLYEGNCWNPINDDSYVYFMDCDNDYHLTRVQKNNGEKTDISECRVDYYNIYGNYAYYQKNDAENEIYELCRKALDGSSEEEVISQGVYCDINITSNYVYFRSFGNQDAFFQTPTNGPINVTELQIENEK